MLYKLKLRLERVNVCYTWIVTLSVHFLANIAFIFCSHQSLLKILQFKDSSTSDSMLMTDRQFKCSCVIRQIITLLGNIIVLLLHGRNVDFFGQPRGRGPLLRGALGTCLACLLVKTALLNSAVQKYSSSTFWLFRLCVMP